MYIKTLKTLVNQFMSKRGVVKFKLWFCDTVYIIAIGMFGGLSNKLSVKISRWYINKVIVLEVKIEFPGISTETSKFISCHFNKLTRFPGTRRIRIDPHQKKMFNPSIAGGWKERNLDAD